MRRTICLAITMLLAAPAAAAEDSPFYGQVVVPGVPALQVEVADTPALRARGYMFRDGVGPEDGMLFPLGETGVHSFWMKNVRFPLDMIWLDGRGAVLHVEAEVPPCEHDPCPSYGPMVQASFVLELDAGRSAELGIEPGVEVQILIPTDGGD